MDYPEGIGLNQGYSPFLTDLALAYVPDQSTYIARRIFPNVPVAARGGQYNILKRDAFLRSESKKLDNYEAAPIKGFGYDKDSYYIDKYGIATLYTDMDLAEAEVAGIGGANHRDNKVQLVTIDPLITLELITQALIVNTSNWTISVTGIPTGTPVAGTSFLQWDNVNSTPIEDIRYLKQAFLLNSGLGANKMLMSNSVLQKLLDHPEVIRRITYNAGQNQNNPVQVTPQTLAALFGFSEILIANSVYNTAKEGEVKNIIPIWGRNVFIYYAPDAPSKETPSAGYFFSWTGGAFRPFTTQGTPNADGLFIRKYWENRPPAYFIESEWFTTPKVTGADLGILMTNVIASSSVAP